MGGIAPCTKEFQAMARKKVTLSFITNDSTRKATFKKRKKGLIKKLNELSTLCGIEACAVIYSPFETLPEAWPSPVGVQRVLARFRGLSEMDQSRKMVNLESFARQRIAKGNDQLKKLIKENREKEMTRVMFDCLTGSSLHGLTMLDLRDLGWVIDQHLNDIARRCDLLTDPVAQNENQALAALPPPVMEGGGDMMPGYGGQNMAAMEAMQGSQPWNPATMNMSQDHDHQTMGFNVDDIILPFEDGNNTSVWSPFSP